MLQQLTFPKHNYLSFSVKKILRASELHSMLREGQEKKSDILTALKLLKIATEQKLNYGPQV